MSNRFNIIDYELGLPCALRHKKKGIARKMDFRKEQLKHINDVEKAVEAFKLSVNVALHDAAEAQKTANRRDYSDFTAEAAARMRKQASDTIAANLAKRIKQARQDLKLEAGHYLQQMRDDVEEQNTRLPANRAVFDALQVYQTFKIPMTEADVKALAAEAGGNLLALRAIASVASQSDITVKIPSADDFISIADDFEKATDKAGFSEWIENPLYISSQKKTSGVSEAVAKKFESEYSMKYEAEKGHEVPMQLLDISAFTEAFNRMKAIKKAIETEGVKISKGGGEDESTEKTEEQKRQERKAAAAAVDVNGSEAERLAQTIGKDKAQSAEAARNAVEAYSVGG